MCGYIFGMRDKSHVSGLRDTQISNSSDTHKKNYSILTRSEFRD